MSNHEPFIYEANQLIADGEYEAALEVVNQNILDSQEPGPALFMAAMAECRMQREGIAFMLLKLASAIEPKRSEVWNNMGHCLKSTAHDAEAKRYFLRAFEINPDDAATLANLCAVETALGQHERALAWADKALAVNPEDPGALYNSSLSLLALGRWEEGWKRYRNSIGNAQRTIRHIDLPRWQGERCEVVVYGEQGLGDEIMFASMLPDAIGAARKVHLECTPRLQRLFARSFPEARVYGTRGQEPTWRYGMEGLSSIEIGGLGEFFRPSPDDCPRTPYLVADPEQRLQWRALLDSLGPEPKIGIAWNGGVPTSGKSFRSVPLMELRPLLEAEAHWISLEYRDPSEDLLTLEAQTGIRVHHWERAAEAYDYDATAALVAELDMVVSVTTTVVDLCGALGKPCLALVPKNAPWRYEQSGEQPFWYGSVACLRQRKADEWGPVIEEARCRLPAS